MVSEKKSNIVKAQSLYRMHPSSKFDRSSRTTCLALEERGSVLLHKVSIRCGALAAFDVGIDVVCNCLLDSLWRDAPLESSPRPVTRTGSTQFVEDVLIDVIVISIHHGDNFVEIPKNRVLSLD